MLISTISLTAIVTAVTAFTPSHVRHLSLSPSIERRGITNAFQELSAVMTLDGQEIRGPITPLGNFILVRTKDTLDATSGGILLPDQVRWSVKVKRRLDAMFIGHSLR